jgi:hypothetical protein
METTRSNISGLLYEGNFDEWLLRMRATLAQRFAGDVTIQGPRFSHLKIVSNSSKWNNELVAIFILWGHTSSYIKLRIPEDQCQHPTILLRALSRVATPFRFMDLPPELRNRVYSMAASSGSSTVSLTPGYARQGSGRANDRRSLLCVDRQVRAEFLPVYYNDRCFEISWQRSSSWWCLQQGFGTEVVQSINDWASVLRAESLKLLRQVRVKLRVRPGINVPSRPLRFSLDRINGKFEVKCSEHEWLKPRARSLLEEHAIAMSTVAQASNLEGEALIIVLASRPEIWNQLSNIEEWGHYT